MSDTSATEPASAAAASDGHLWPRVIAIVTIAGGGFAWLVANYAEAAPVLSSPPLLIVALFTAYALGHLSNYWMVAVPLLKRVQASEARIAQAEARERHLSEQITALRESIARHETALEYIKQQAGPAKAKRKVVKPQT